MTIIAAMLDARTQVAIIASDSDGVGGCEAQDYGPKVLQLGPRVAVGWSGSYLLSRWARGSLAALLTSDDGEQHTEPERFRPKLEEAWDAWRVFAKARDLKVGDNAAIMGFLLVVTPSLIYMCSSDGAVLPCKEYSAIGSGSEAALGALFTLTKTRERYPNFKVEEAVRMAIEGAIRHITSCGGEVHLLSVGAEP